ncbi:MAG: glutathione S-transferase N-terminal domain-containing protein [Rhodospirillaceae bacterium]|nr:glutathione S-transferase N-terminal domain-containing protein [Rhodospirillaceae bacterium]
MPADAATDAPADTAIQLYSWATPNGFKVSILLEELGLPYQAHPVDIGAGDQFKPAFLEISPNNKIPAIVDPDGPGGRPYSVFESGAILLYLAHKTGAFWPEDPRKLFDMMQWLMFQMGGVGPMLGQAHHFRQYAPEPIDYAINRYTNEAGRLYGVMDKRLSRCRFLAGEDYSLADIATFPWVRSIERQGHTLDAFPNVKRWFGEIDPRPAVQKGLTVLTEFRKEGFDQKAKDLLFGKGQYEKR